MASICTGQPAEMDRHDRARPGRDARGDGFRIDVAVVPTSASTGVAPTWMMVLTVAQNVSGVVMTSSPGTDTERRERQVQARPWPN